MPLTYIYDPVALTAHISMYIHNYPPPLCSSLVYFQFYRSVNIWFPSIFAITSCNDFFTAPSANSAIAANPFPASKVLIKSFNISLTCWLNALVVDLKVLKNSHHKCRRSPYRDSRWYTPLYNGSLISSLFQFSYRICCSLIIGYRINAFPSVSSLCISTAVIWEFSYVL